jgi:hypothetical protein
MIPDIVPLKKNYEELNVVGKFIIRCRRHIQL